jgi:ABC-type uncharacterized transport system permease subunit
VVRRLVHWSMGGVLVPLAMGWAVVVVVKVLAVAAVFVSPLDLDGGNLTLVKHPGK